MSSKMEKGVTLAIIGSLLKLLLLHILPSLLDMTSDILNSLDMLGYNATTALAHGTMLRHFLGPDLAGHSVDPTWGILGLVLVFLPGIPCLVFLISVKTKEKQLCFKPLYLVTICYPLATILLWVGNILGIIVDYHPDKSFLIRELYAAEAFFESCPQMILQLFTIQRGYPFGAMQGVTIALSFILLIKASIVFEWTAEEGGKQQGGKPKWMRFLSSLPLYVTGIIFRVGCTSLMVGHLGKWSVIPITVRCVVYGLIAGSCGYRENLPIAVLGNIGTITTGVVTKTAAGQPGRAKFLRMSILYTFFHLTGLLFSILVVANLKPDLFSHLVYFKQINYVFPTIIFVGVINLYFISHRAAETFEEIIEMSSKKGDEEVDL